MFRAVASMSAVVAAGILIWPTASLADSKIGVAAAAKNQVQGILGGSSRPLSAGSELFSNETVRTGEASQAQLLFLDQTNLSVGARSESQARPLRLQSRSKDRQRRDRNQSRRVSVRQRIAESQELHDQDAVRDDRRAGHDLQYANRQDRRAHLRDARPRTRAHGGPRVRARRWAGVVAIRQRKPASALGPDRVCFIRPARSGIDRVSRQRGLGSSRSARRDRIALSRLAAKRRRLGRAGDPVRIADRFGLGCFSLPVRGGWLLAKRGSRVGCSRIRRLPTRSRFARPTSPPGR
jgi:hypothetical protein